MLGLSQSGRPITLRFLSLSEHREIIEAAREFCRVASTRTSPPTIAEWPLLAAQFTETERVEYLDKA